MADFTIEEICLATQGKVHGVRSIDGIKGISTDTRTVKAGALLYPWLEKNLTDMILLTKR